MAQISSYVDPDLGQALINNIEVEVDNNISPDAPTPEEETEILRILQKQHQILIQQQKLHKRRKTL